MSFLQYPEVMSSSELQVWNNAAFDDEELPGLSLPMKTSWSSLHPVSENQSDSLGSDCSKENMSPTMVNSTISMKSLIPNKPLCSNGALGGSQRKPVKVFARNSGSSDHSPVLLKKGCEQEGGKTRDEKKIDAEIEEVENEIKRLSSRLETLRLEKAERNLKTVEKRGRIVPAKFMEPKQCVMIAEAMKKIEETPLSNARAKINRRGVSLGPTEIVAGARFRQPGKLDTTPVQPLQSRRKSCFWKLQGIEEGKAVSERRKSLSLSPKSRKTAVNKIQAQKQVAATTVGSRKCLKKDDGVLSLIQPRKLFKDDGAKSVPAKKPLKPGRVVASRYNQIATTGNSTAIDARKRSLPENDKNDGKRCDKRRASSVGKSRGNQGTTTEVRIKKRWEIPTEIVVYKSEEEDKSSLSSIANYMTDDVLPMIRTIRCTDESPRDSGAAKRVVELIGKKSYFCPDEEDVEKSVCQALSFGEDFDNEG